MSLYLKRCSSQIILWWTALLFSGNVHFFTQGHYYIPLSMSDTPNAIGYPHLGGIHDDP